MKLAIKTVLFAAAVAWASASQAAPTRFDVEYTTGGGDVLAFSLMGELQSDGNTIVVDSILDFATLNGVDGPSLEHLVGAMGDPTVSLDGSVMMSLSACDDSVCANAFDFLTSFAFGRTFSGFGFFDSPTERFNADNWRIASVSVPEPATLALLGLGLAGLGFSRRKQ